MKNILFKVLLFGMAAAFCSESIAQDEEEGVIFKCRPCNLPCDLVEHANPGLCEVCYMPLFASFPGLETQNRLENQTLDKTVAILVFPGVQIIDFTGPYEVFEAAGAQVFTVAEKLEQVTAGQSMKIFPDYTFETAPQADILIVPGGNVDNTDQKILDWIVKTNAKSEKTMSVCNGAFFLSSAGLLDGLTATTTFGLVPSLQESTPQAKVLDYERYVDNGHIITTAGLSSGIDGALYVVSQYLGTARTKEIANGLELDWRPQGGFVRGRLADKHVIGMRDVFTQFPRKLLLYDGDTEHWEFQMEIHTSLETKQVMKLLSTQLESVQKWSRAEEDMLSSTWRFENIDGENWAGKVKLDPNPEGKAFLVSVSVSKQ